ncbi:carbohydrate ABC transporter permease [Clostridium thermosuccinogenes]|uniref:carbohydrate ABC transporter permease n=1 Tax=Clostridium thermosuccinogenes TaxID=84032 RepID=UPI000CCC9E91|nr:sugar ABC transporter permease [Pseudoclostridium thermosuccinogenes]PNT93357.1 ABC transporter permease [Pseudoclostridium thermosuccinogenes]
MNTGLAVKNNIKANFNVKHRLSRTWKEVKKKRICYLFAAPYMIIFFTFTALPVIISLFLGFTSFNLLEAPVFVGVENYIRLFLDDDIFIKAIGNTFILAVMTGPISYIMCLMFAWLINELPKALRTILTLVFYAPSISGNVYLVWGILFNKDSYGFANSLLLRFNIITSPILWFEDPKYMMPLLIIVSLWTSIGTSFLSFVAGLQGIDKGLYEAAAVDGVKNRWQELWYVTLPSMKPQLMFGAVMSITGSFGVGGIVTALCGMPSKDYAAHTIINHLEDYGNIRFEMGYASAIATVLFFIMIFSNKIVQKILARVGD